MPVSIGLKLITFTGKKTMHQYDITIIGGGPIGLTCGLAAQKAGLTCVIIEKGVLVNSLVVY
jgi:flavin-dependent dehydrogenase